MPRGIYKRHPHQGFQKGKNNPNYGKDYRGEKSPNWKGGKILKDGYVAIHSPNHPFCNGEGYIYEHRLVVEKQIGRYLHRWEVTHHVEEIKIDNRPEKLMAFDSHSAHRRFEQGEKVQPEEIIFDGRKQT